MKIGIMSDSHDHMENIKKCIEIFKVKEVDYVLHLGDFVSPNAVRACVGIRLVGIFGNNDGDTYRLIEAFSAVKGKIMGDFYEFEEDNIKFACYHGSELRIKDALIECGKYDVVIYGHTHKYVNAKTGNTLVLNPGTVHGFEFKPTVMVFHTGTKEAELIDL